MGLSFRSLDLQTDNLKMDLYRGYFEPPEVRGTDDVIPGRPGRDEQIREADKLALRIEGYVVGTGSTEDERSQSWHEATMALMAVLDRTLASGALIVSAPYLGLPSGTRTIMAKTVNMIGGPAEACMSLQRWSIDLEAIGSPPVWEEDESS